MGTKNQPSVYRCYENAEPDEPMFILLGRDPVASHLVRLWAWARGLLGKTEQPQLDEALKTADEMDVYARALGKGSSVAFASAAVAESALRFGISSDVPEDHVDRFIDDYKQNEYARWMLMYLRFPAHWQLAFRSFYAGRELYCTYDQQRYRVTMASRFGHIGLAPARAPLNTGYVHTVSPFACSLWDERA